MWGGSIHSNGNAGTHSLLVRRRDLLSRKTKSQSILEAEETVVHGGCCQNTGDRLLIVVRMNSVLGLEHRYADRPPIWGSALLDVLSVFRLLHTVQFDGHEA